MDPYNILSLKVKKPLSALNIDWNGLEATARTTIMQTLGVQVQEVNDMILAIKFLLNGSYYDIITINMDLPFGLEGVSALRSLGIPSKLIGFTSEGAEMIQGLLHAGLDHCMKKPVGLLSFAEVLEKIVDSDDE
ncbi:hypothetical protein ACHQM5_001379 [Ranunculus cassubicifolius]